jgi:hypothetical protein
MNNKITSKDLPNDAFFIVKKCLLCGEGKNAEPFEVPFPNLASAKAFMDAVNERNVASGDVTVSNNITTVVDDMGETHRYITGVIHITNKVVYNNGDDIQEQQKFNDIIESLDLDNPDNN